MRHSRMAGAEAGADEGVSWVVSPPFPAVTVPLTACAGVPPAWHNQGRREESRQPPGVAALQGVLHGDEGAGHPAPSQQGFQTKAAM